MGLLHAPVYLPVLPLPFGGGFFVWRMCYDKINKREASHDDCC